jgi:hypothetical protein
VLVIALQLVVALAVVVSVAASTVAVVDRPAM